MKRVFLALCTVVMVLMACSNDDSSDSIITDKDVMYISNSGGTDTIKVLNHHHMWLISDAEVHFNDSTYWVSPIQNEVSPHQFEMDGKWFKIVIPNDNTNLIVASVTGNALASSDRWYIKINISAGGESDKFILVKSKEHQMLHWSMLVDICRRKQSVCKTIARKRHLYSWSLTLLLKQSNWPDWE